MNDSKPLLRAVPPPTRQVGDGAVAAAQETGLDIAFLTAVLQQSTHRALIAFDRDGVEITRNDAAREWFTPAVELALRPRLAQALGQLSLFPDHTVHFPLALPGGDLQCRVQPVVGTGPLRGCVLSLMPLRVGELAEQDAERVRWRYALENAEDGLWDWSADTDRVFRSPRCYNMLGYPAGMLPETTDAWSKLVHPHDLDAQKEAIRSHLAGNSASYHSEYRIRDAYGEWRWMLDRGKIIERSEAGQPRRVVGTHTDITRYKDMELRLRERELLLDEAQRIGRVGSWSWDAATQIVTWSDELYRITGWPLNQRPPAWEGQGVLFTPESYARMRILMEQSFLTGIPFRTEVEMLRPDGERRQVEIAGEMISEAGTKGSRLVGVVRDVTDERRADETARWRSKLFNRIAAMGNIGGFDLVLATRAFQWTEENYRLHGVAPGTPVTLDFQLAQYDDASRERLAALVERMIAGESDEETAEVNFITPDDRRLVLRLTASVERHDGEPYRITGLTQDITREREAGQRIEQLAHFDTLTSLPNRFLFRQRADEAIAMAKRAKLSLALMYIDLDRFKNVNDSQGHAAGDQLLQEVAGRLKSCVRGSDLVGRLGGDEFGVMLCEVRRPEDAGLVAEKIIAAINAPVTVDGGEVQVGCSIGIALLSADTEDLTALMRAADAAMYAAKDAGRNNHQFYSDAFFERVQRRLSLESELRLALPRNEMSVVYQPTVCVRDGSVRGFEALLRWRRSNGEACLPAEFIPVAEESGEIVAIGRWVLREACRQASAWRDQGLSFERMAVNVSAMQLRDADFAEQVLAICADTGWSPHRLVLELTESALMRDTEILRTNFAVLEAAGTRLAVDDIGTGFSNLNYLHRFPVQHLKIDRSFVSQMLGDSQLTVLTQAIVHLGHALGLTVVAEGVETDAELAALRAQGCDEVQGYLYTRPLPPDELVDWMQALAAKVVT